MGHPRLAALPTEEREVSVYARVEVHEAGLQVLRLRAERADFGDIGVEFVPRIVEIIQEARVGFPIVLRSEGKVGTPVGFGILDEFP